MSKSPAGDPIRARRAARVALGQSWTAYKREHEHELPPNGPRGTPEYRARQRATAKLYMDFLQELGNPFTGPGV